MFLLWQNHAEASADLAATRSLAKEWVAAEKALADEHNAWEAKRQLLDDLLDLVAALRASIAAITENASQADKAQSELVMQRDALEMHRSKVAEFLEGITPSIRERSKLGCPSHCWPSWTRF